MSESFESLKLFIEKSEWRDFFPETILMDTELEADVGLYGDEAIEFIVKYARYFNVDISNFDAKRFFASEGGLNVIFRKNNSRSPLLISDLVNGIQQGELVP